MRSFRRTLEFLRPYRRHLALAILLTVVVTTLNIVPPRLFEFAIDNGIKPALAAFQSWQSAEGAAKAAAEANWVNLRDHTGPQLLLMFSLLLVGAIALRAYLNYLLALLVNFVGHRFCFDLRFATWRHLQRLSLAFHKQIQTGKIMARATADVELIQGVVSGQLVAFLSDLITLVVVTSILFTMEWRIAAVILALVPLYVVSYLFFLKHIRSIREEQRRLYDEQVGQLTEKIANIAVVKAFVRENDETKQFVKLANERFAVDVRQMHLNRRLGLISGVISAVGRGIVYAYGGFLVQQGQLTVGSLVAVAFYVGYVFDPAVRVVDFNNQLQWAVAAMDRVFETLDTRPDIEDREGALALPRLSREIRFDHVSFKYEQGEEIVHDIDLTVACGEVVGIVGHSGSGKTTLMNLLMRFYDPTKGRVSIDGVDLREVRLDSVRAQISMVAQENMAFSVSIKENIKYGCHDATDEQMVAAAKAADLHEFVETLDDGYETMIGEHGVRFSGGQRQRLALARALVTDPAVLILDDVTSALDGETEARVQEALRRVMKGRTTFIIAHRLASVVDADRILVVEDGRIVDQGPHAELVARPGIYQDMFREQFKGALEIA
ncbi:MAG: ABC transporter ATP-binding protein [Fimbriimonadaceae bacterium]|nr:ABC transporter ATP-binding protein [Fimbriimonadaceae bacterium]